MNIKNQDFINAAKALLSIILTLLCIYRFSDFGAIYFALYIAACCSFMQAGETKAKQLLSMSLAGGAFLFFLIFGLLIKAHYIWANIALVIFAFWTFYLPNFGLVYKISPALGLIFYELVISMPTHNTHFVNAVLASVISVVISILIYFLFWPYDVKHELTLLAQTLISQYHLLLKKYYLMMRRSNRWTRKTQLNQLQEDLKNINNLLAGYEKINEAGEIKKEEGQFFDLVYIKLYSLSQINQLVIECFPNLDSEAQSVCQQLFKDLIAKCNAIDYRFDQMVPHSLIAQHLLRKSLKLGKTLTRPLLAIRNKPRKVILSEQEFNQLLEKLILDNKTKTKHFAFGLLRIHELINELYQSQEQMHFTPKRGMFL